MSDQPLRAIRVRITGRVQNVGFRASLADEARRAGVTGWCRNTPLGDVEAYLCGPDQAVQKVLVWCHRGPSQARVDTVTERPAEVDPELKGFATRR